ncbi:MAG: cystathionine beta-lyase, partial [Alphaproteobacteria bacterium]|nr:cystathionine beta-lyase [Alphaproteobacteria bacterium]
GHSDAMLGVVTCRDAESLELVRAWWNMTGLCAGPDDIYLGTRGIRTMSVRLARHQENAMRVATWLQGRPEVERVLYPALPDDPGHAIWKRDFTGASGLFGLLLNPASPEAVAAMLDGLELFGMGSSWGGFESLIVPSDPSAWRTATVWNPAGPLLRLHIGLEDPEDLIADLEAGFARLRAAG